MLRLRLVNPIPLRRRAELACVALVAAFALAVGCGAGEIVSGCENDRDCGGVCIESLPGGLCTQTCDASGDCPAGSVCADTEVEGGICLLTCASNQECRDQLGSGYVCDTESELPHGEDVRVCID